ncbi:hypothetical protein K7432_001450 [Basidiobolus ranarum]|uniref:CAP-Gly domain-containing protein n=1 Tax=Basidiobolus ranarum TaxID=34480 RepID=A0ABR2X336_9FUNG
MTDKLYGSSPFSPTIPSSPTTPSTPGSHQLGNKVLVQNKPGVIRFIGNTAFAKGRWIGVELDEPLGKNDGIVGGKVYFKCRPKHGMFVRASQLKSLHGTPAKRLFNDSATPETSRNSATPVTRFSRSNTHNGQPSIQGTPSRLPHPSKMGTTPTPSRSMSQRSASGSGRFTTPRPRRNIPSFEANSESASPTLENASLVLPPEEVETEDEQSSNPTVDDEHNSTESDETPQTPTHERTGKPGQVVPIKDYEELRLKLKVLENKRLEDREKWKEFEKVRNEAEQFMTIRSKLVVKLSELQQELRENRKSLKQAILDRENFENKHNDVSESLELMTLDKEMAEEKIENLTQEVALLRERIEEMAIELDVFKKAGESNFDGEGRSEIEIVQIERQNERLKEALVRLRDVTVEQETELNRKIKSLEKEVYSFQDLESTNKKLREQLDQSDNQVEDLKLRLDDAIGSEEIIEQLSEKNLALNEKIEEMKLVIDDLEALKELNDELEENHCETEKQLLAEIDIKDTSIRELKKSFESTEETIGDYENTINQFRQLVNNLQGDLEQLKQKEAIQTNESKDLNIHSQAMLNLNLQLQSTAMKAQAKQIDLDLRKLEADQATELLSYIKSYMPESFFINEYDSLRCLFLMKRLSFKTDLINKHISQNHQVVDALPAETSEELISVCEMRERLAWFSDLASRFVVHMSNCAPQEFLKLGPIYHELVGAERRLNNFTELLKKEDLNESQCLADLHRAVSQLEHLSESHLSNPKAFNFEMFHSLVRSVEYSADHVISILGHTEAFFQSPEFYDDFGGFDGVDKETVLKELLSPLSSLVQKAKTVKVVAKKLLRYFNGLSEQSMSLKPELIEQYRKTWRDIRLLVQFSSEAWKRMYTYALDKKDSKTLAQLSSLQSILFKTTEEVLKVGEVTPWDSANKIMEGISQELNRYFDLVHDTVNLQKVEINPAPWVKRSQVFKSEIVLSSEMDRKVAALNEEIIALIREGKIKDQSLEETAVKIELLEKRMNQVKKHLDRIGELEKELSRAKEHEKIYEEAIESLQSELDATNQSFERAMETRKQDPTSDNVPESTSEPSHPRSIVEHLSQSHHHYSQQMESLKEALRYLRSENAHLKSQKTLDSLGFDLQSRMAVTNPMSGKVKTNEKLKSITIETKKLVKDVHTVYSTARIIDISGTKPVKKWTSLKTVPQYRLQIQKSVLHTLHYRSDELKEQLKKLHVNQLQTQSNSCNLIYAR